MLKLEKLSFDKKIVGQMFTGKQLTLLIYPLIIEQILAVTVGMVDTMMISYAGEAAMSGVSLVDMINNLLIAVFAAIATGGAVVVSQYLGHQEREQSCKAAEQLLVVITVIALGITTICVLFRTPILKLLFGSIEADVMESALIYFLISAFSFPFLAVFNACAAVYRSMGNSKISMQVSIGMNFFNAIGNAILIFGFSLGAAGAALSTLAARMLAAIVMFVLMLGKNKDVYVVPKKLFFWDSEMIGRIIHIAVPNGIENGLFQLGRVLVVSIIALFGTTQIAANAVANNLDSVGCIAGGAMNLAMITVIGQCMGAGRKEEAVFYTKKLLKVTYIITAIVNTTLLISLPTLLNLYTLSPEAYKLSFILVCIHNTAAIFMWPSSFTLSYALRAAGDVRYTMIVAIFSVIVFRIVFSVILGIGFGMGAIGVWIAMLIDWAFRITLFYIRFFSGKWLECKVI